MRLEARITNGPFQGRKIFLRSGQMMKIGRTELADFAVPHDANMSRIHFALECHPSVCKVVDLHSINGTRVNDQPIESHNLTTGDIIKAGTTIFSVTVIDTGLVANIASVLNAPPKGSTQTTQSSIPPLSSQPITAIAAPMAADLSVLVSNEYPFVSALQDDDPAIRQTAFLAAAWQSQPWLLDYCRRSCVGNIPQDEIVYWLLAVLGKPSDAAAILALARNKELKEKRGEILATFGHPSVIPELIRMMKSHDVAAALIACSALKKITGQNFVGRRNPATPDAEEPPDFEQAEKFWANAQQTYFAGTRWRNGLEISGDVPSETLEKLDMKTRWEICLRNTYEGRVSDASLTLASYQRFPW